jgi:hypothetical protein
MSLVLEKYILMYDNDRCKEMIICHMVFGTAVIFHFYITNFNQIKNQIGKKDNNF